MRTAPQITTTDEPDKTRYLGQEVVKNEKEAIKWCRMAADRGYVDAKSALNKLEKQQPKD
jgi:TPR repeat protein|tara:strand:- start:153 stop:332 length:180 start_codon:yes stop_codon:yes gene_type:complete